MKHSEFRAIFVRLRPGTNKEYYPKILSEKKEEPFSFRYKNEVEF